TMPTIIMAGVNDSGYVSLGQYKIPNGTHLVIPTNLANLLNSYLSEKLNTTISTFKPGDSGADIEVYDTKIRAYGNNKATSNNG
ncbi:hypothetical protein, partial [Clostridium sp. DL1XJH146]